MAIPKQVVDWFGSVFADANRDTCERIYRVPGTPEPHLDTAFVSYLMNYAAPRRFPSGWAIRFDVHYLGGLWHWRTWEIADIGVFVFFQQNGKVIRRKVTLLQSKRLYPFVGNVDELEVEDYVIGMARVGDRDPNQPALLLKRQFRFTKRGRYGALIKGSKQYEAMEGHNKQYGLPIYYLLYNPHTTPLSVRLPHTKDVRLRGAPVLGTRVVPMEKLHGYLQLKTDENYSPTLRDIKFVIGPNASQKNQYGWRLEHFMADLLLSCREGKRITKSDDDTMFDLFNRRSGPIAAAVAVTVEVPEDEELPE